MGINLLLSMERRGAACIMFLVRMVRKICPLIGAPLGRLRQRSRLRRVTFPQHAAFPRKREAVLAKAHCLRRRRVNIASIPVAESLAGLFFTSSNEANYFFDMALRWFNCYIASCRSHL